MGRAGLRALRSRLTRWRLDLRWYAIALVTAPLLDTVVLGAFSLRSRAYLPHLVTAADPTSLLLAGLIMGLLIPFFGEIGWTGFAAAEIGTRHGVFATGLIVGLPWCLLHLPLYLVVGSPDVPPAVSVPVMTFSILLPYRVLMVWVFARTGSVPIAVLMHLALNLYGFLLLPPALGGVADVVFNLALGAVLWIVVAAATALDGRGLRHEFGGPGAQVPRASSATGRRLEPPR